MSQVCRRLSYSISDQIKLTFSLFKIKALTCGVGWLMNLFKENMLFKLRQRFIIHVFFYINEWTFPKIMYKSTLDENFNALRQTITVHFVC